MSTIKLKHSGGNSVSLNPPTSAPTSSDVAFKLPNADGSANQLLKTDGSGNLGWATDQGGKVVGFGLATSTTVTQLGAQNSYTLVGPQLTYSGASASNKLVILHNHHMKVEDASNWWMALWRDGTSGTKLVEKKWYSQDQLWIGQTGIHSCCIDFADTNSHTYQFAIYREGSTDRLQYNPIVGVTQIIALEIQP